MSECVYLEFDVGSREFTLGFGEYREPLLHLRDEEIQVLLETAQGFVPSDRIIEILQDHHQDPSRQPDNKDAGNLISRLRQHLRLSAWGLALEIAHRCDAGCGTYVESLPRAGKRRGRLPRQLLVKRMAVSRRKAKQRSMGASPAACRRSNAHGAVSGRAGLAGSELVRRVPLAIVHVRARQATKVIFHRFDPFETRPSNERGRANEKGWRLRPPVKRR